MKFRLLDSRYKNTDSVLYINNHKIWWFQYMAGWNANKYWIWMTRFVVFLMVLKIFNNESVNSTFKYKLEYKFEYKIGAFNTCELVPNITDYKLEFIIQKFKNLD